MRAVRGEPPACAPPAYVRGSVVRRICRELSRFLLSNSREFKNVLRAGALQLIRMGIHGLTSYVGEHNEFFVDLQLRNTDVIIDGNNLYHGLYFNSNLDIRHAELAQKFPDSWYALATLNEAPIAERLLFLFETLGVSTSILEPVPCLLQLPMAVTCYWTKFSEPKVTLQHIKALLLGITFGELDKMLHIPDSERPHAEVNKIVHDQFLKWKEKKSPKDALELDVAHTFCQWQCCLQAGLYLNQLLCSPLPEPDLTRLYNGTLIHRLYHQLNSSSMPENLLSTSPKIYELYCSMVQIVKDSTPPGFFQKSKSQRKKDKKIINKLQATRESTMMDTLPFCSINRFATLAIEN
ncbi:protein asteroid 1 [Crotalus adamanteus]|uniref:Protein asteroid 1 n=1 Tax=Crotalus adamanteus TaxID=8729 RepID=A0AAW1B3G3_CROAD